MSTRKIGSFSYLDSVLEEQTLLFLTTSLLKFISKTMKVYKTFFPFVSLLCYCNSFAGVQVSLSVENSGVVYEGAGVMAVTVSLTGNLRRDVTVTINTIPGTGIYYTQSLLD